jgi:hypothetical protein
VPALDPEQLAALYAEIAEEGMADYGAGLSRQDAQ